MPQWKIPREIFVRADLPIDIDIMRRLLVRVMLAAVILLLVLTGLFVRVEERGHVARERFHERRPVTGRRLAGAAEV